MRLRRDLIPEDTLCRAFKSNALDHSATTPLRKLVRSLDYDYAVMAALLVAHVGAVPAPELEPQHTNVLHEDIRNIITGYF